MMRDQQLSPERDDDFSDRIMQSVRDKVVLSKRSELLDYLDLLIPEYEMPAGSTGPVADKRQVYDWSEFLEFYGEDFIRNAYLCILKREADAGALQSAEGGIDAEESSRLIFLGRLRDSEEGCTHATKIKGLWVRYRYELARLEQKPLRSRLFGLLMKLGRSSRPRKETALEIQGREIAECNKEIAEVEKRLMQHYNDTLKHLKREVAEAITADITR